MKTATDKLKQRLRQRRSAPVFDPKADGLSSGLTLVNLACSGDPSYAFRKGHYFLFVGDSQAGKTWLLMQTLAEAAVNPNFKNYRLIHDNPERGALMDVRRYFGGLADRLEPPSRYRMDFQNAVIDGKTGPSSSTLEEFYDNVDDACRAGKPFIYGLDSEDALPPEADLEKSQEDKRARRKGKEISGSYGTAKPKVNSAKLREAHNALAVTSSMLFVIKQTRDNIGFDAAFNPKTRSGGRALTFYATAELWFSISKRIKREVKGHKIVQGSVLKIHVKKNRLAGLDRAVEIPFYPATGFDEVGSLVNFLVEWDHWPEHKGIVTAGEFDFEGGREKLVTMIEQKGLEKELRLFAAAAWDEIEAAARIERKPRY